MKGVLVVSSDVKLELLCLWVFHDSIEVLSAHTEGLYVVNRLVEELRALVVEARIVIDHADNLFLLAHQNLHSEEHLVEKPVPDADSTLSDVNNFEDFLVLVLDHVAVCLDVKSWLQGPDELNQEVPHFLVLERILEVLVILHARWHEVVPVRIEEIREEVVNDDLSLHVVWQLIHESLIHLVLNG